MDNIYINLDSSPQKFYFKDENHAAEFLKPLLLTSVFSYKILSVAGSPGAYTGLNVEPLFNPSNVLSLKVDDNSVIYNADTSEYYPDNKTFLRQFVNMPITINRNSTVQPGLLQFSLDQIASAISPTNVIKFSYHFGLIALPPHPDSFAPVTNPPLGLPAAYTYECPVTYAGAVSDKISASSSAMWVKIDAFSE